MTASNESLTTVYYNEYLLTLMKINEPWEALAAYLCPTGVIIAIVANIINFIVIPKLKHGVGGTTRVYYLAIAVLDFLEAVVIHAFNFFLSQGIEYASRMTIRLD